MSAKFGAATNLTRLTALRGVESSKKCVLALWFKVADGGGGHIFWGSNSGTARIALFMSTDDGSLQFVLRDANVNTLYSATSATGYDDNAWHHMIISADLSATTVQWYIDRAAITPTVGAGPTDGTIGFVANQWKIGQAFNDTGTNFQGTLYDLLFYPGVYIDLSDADNLKYFVSSDGRTNADTGYEYQKYEPTGIKPVGYGHDFSFPTNGIQPAIAFSGGFTQNRGTGGAFTLSTGFSSQSSPDNPNAYRGAARWATPGQRWFDSEQSGFSYPRAETFIEDREGHPAFGKRMGLDERDESTRDVGPLRAESVSTLVRGGDEQDDEDTRWQP